LFESFCNEGINVVQPLQAHAGVFGFGARQFGPSGRDPGTPNSGEHHQNQSASPQQPD
jgi:hypothetical protein